MGASLIKKLRELCQVVSSEGQGHNAAVILASPGLTNIVVDNEAFTQELVSWLGEHEGGQFHLLSAIVDGIPASLSSKKTPSEGIAVLRGPSDVILPQLGNPEFLRDRRDHDTVGALSFSGLGDPSSSTIAVPLTRTIFHNARPSTLIASRFDLTTPGTPRLIESGEAVRQHINLADSTVSGGKSSRRQPHLWLPLTSVSSSRKVTESFGNILRRLDHDGKSSPASSELEANIGTIRKAILDASPEVETALPGVWAVVDPTPGETINFRNWQIDHPRDVDMVSGGGGWGDKAGLLSLDPETSPFAASEEENMRNLFGIGGASDYAPVGSEVQFFVPDLVAGESHPHDSHGLLFGVSRYDPGTTTAAEPLVDQQEADIAVTPGRFGVLCEEGIYVSGEDARPFKLSVPGSLVSIP
ncbi:V-type H+-transporting ATPase 16kDa proteolipid subunit [Geosmithia morbida]|uniref:V-type H+-transporting ATPase 16kDa proteolipid subunit n=1 Tax=Geosmithia morbida TaxID=1094350 RepID=A0A9P4YXK5_9HYPO|nr:V-type H+-transporting ATPase 16kDa proteolipid subunit [Geosmithia morbida]KAF4123538.1 V-type H+-transporting ATPase 16kDa proteolipid subunit [Geosmithia morbida]